MKYKEIWNYKEQKYEWKEFTKDDWYLEATLKDKFCQFCGKTANGLTLTGSLMVFHCSSCRNRLGQNAINSCLPIGKLTKSI